MSSSDAPPHSSSVARSPTVPTTGRLAVLTGLSLAASAIPIPFLPDRAVAQIRGALAHDVAARHGLSLTSDARSALAATSAESPVRAVVKNAIGILSKTILKKLGPVAVLSTASSGVEVYALGVLLEHYIEHRRSSSAVRINAEEAREVRHHIDKAILRAFSPALRPRDVPLLPGTEDLRDELTRYVDTAILFGASLPSYIERRLISAFDAVHDEAR